MKFKLVNSSRTDYTVCGMLTCTSAKKIYCLSATIDNFQKAFYTQVLDVPAGKIIEYPKMLRIGKPAQDPLKSMKAFRTADKAETLVQIEQNFIVNKMEFPVMVFVEQSSTETEAALDQELQRIADDHKYDFRTVDDAESAKIARNCVQEEARVLIRLKRVFARGYDLKLSKSALVIMVSLGLKLKKDELYQMIGRGDRRQGECESQLIL